MKTANMQMITKVMGVAFMTSKKFLAASFVQQDSTTTSHDSPFDL